MVEKTATGSFRRLDKFTDCLPYDQTGKPGSIEAIITLATNTTGEFKAGTIVFHQGLDPQRCCQIYAWVQDELRAGSLPKPNFPVTLIRPTDLQTPPGD